MPSFFTDMTDQRFPFRRLPDDLCPVVLKTMDLPEIMAYSFVSKKSHSMVTALRLPVSLVQITMKTRPVIVAYIGGTNMKFDLNMHENNGRMVNLNDLPVNVNVTCNHNMAVGFREISLTWSNQGMRLGEWVQHLCSIFHYERCSIADFHVREIEMSVLSLQNTFTQILSVNIIFRQEEEANKHDILSAQNILKVFLNNTYVRLHHIPFQQHFSIQHIAMGNLIELYMCSPRNFRVDDLLTINAERVVILGISIQYQISLHDMNRFFNLWKKGSNRNLKELVMSWDTETIPDWKILLKGLQATDVGAEMTQSRFPFQRLPYDLRSEVLKTMELHEIIIYSLVSKKACSMVKTLCLPITSARVTMWSHPSVLFQIGSISINVILSLLKDAGSITRLENVHRFYFDISTTDKTTYGSKLPLVFRPKQIMTLGQWIQRICSIAHNDTTYSVAVIMEKIEFEVESLRNIFPKIRNIEINYLEHLHYHNRHRLDLPNEKDIASFQNVLKAFLPSVEKLTLQCGPLLDNLSIQQIGMTNLKELKMYSPRNLRVEDLFTFNVNNCFIEASEISLRDLNRFFKLWIKGSNPKMKKLNICWYTNTIPEWNVLFKGLKAEEVEEEGSRKYVIQNCRKVCAKIECMTTQRFPLHRLSDDLRSEVLKIMELHEIIAYSFVSVESSHKGSVGFPESTLRE
ncbi:hypothetical protein B9Z55_011166 [Caenorhabditis nigoni]|uniref:F-box domain-containing protein n=1 Tax=Caenorhabditis nigoni TaxID=1611254 RepID=A0A2G5UIY2_9PELO|nr:hypothetical protein B9Z55_011166 [Caenorhabditis nigoni]